MDYYSHLRDKEKWELEQGLERWRKILTDGNLAHIDPTAQEYVEAYEDELLVRRLLQWAVWRR